MITLGKPLRRRAGVEAAALTGLFFGAAYLARAAVRNPQTTRRLAGGALTAAALTAPLFFFPRRTFAERSVVITGGSRGLGLALARRLLKQNASVTLLARDADELDAAKTQLVSEIPECESRLFTVVADVTECESLDQALAEARARFGQIDVLINNAGAITVGPFNSLEMKDFDEQLNLHVRAVIQATQLIQPHFRQTGGGHIVNISSLGGVMPLPHMTAYSASKFALGGFSEAVASELRDQNIFVTTVYPGLMRTGSPIQATFKGDVEGEYSWFAAGAATPLQSMSADCAAARILKAAADGQARLVLSAPAKLGSLFHSLFPELFAIAAGVVARNLPQSEAKEKVTGAESRSRLEAKGVHLPTDPILKADEVKQNQKPKPEALH